MPYHTECDNTLNGKIKIKVHVPEQLQVAFAYTDRNITSTVINQKVWRNSHMHQIP